MVRLAYFVSPHGFGHAARATAVMGTLLVRRPDAHFDLFTLTPEWFFADSIGRGYSYHSLCTDVGLVQLTPMRADLDETARRLDRFLPFDTRQLAQVADRLKSDDVRLVLCDISPLGLAVARTAGLPSILIENFTWDWIYAEYFDQVPGLRAHADALRREFGSATYRVQTAPFCGVWDGKLRTSPVARVPRTTADAVRRQLELPPGARYAVITMGGVDRQYHFLNRLARYPDVWFVVPGGADRQVRRDNLVLLPYRSPVYHPDLVAGSDAVIGKLGYSTLAEAYHAGAPLGFVRRPGFRESEVLAAYAQAHMPTIEVPEAEFESGDWEAFLPELLTRSRHEPGRPNGADEIAAFVDSLLARPAL
jgi:hypothetical protein